MSNVSLNGISNAYLPDLSTVNGAGESAGPSFADTLNNAVYGVNQLHNDAAAQVSNLLQGGNADVNSVMIAVEKADVSFQLMMQVRNKIVNAYQEIEKMQF
jgi:flagellar hook-basal body complex protein FliE